MNITRFIAIAIITIIKIASLPLPQLSGWADGMLIGYCLLTMLECIEDKKIEV